MKKPTRSWTHFDADLRGMKLLSEFYAEQTSKPRRSKLLRWRKVQRGTYPIWVSKVCEIFRVAAAERGGLGIMKRPDCYEVFLSIPPMGRGGLMVGSAATKQIAFNHCEKIARNLITVIAMESTSQRERKPCRTTKNVLSAGARR